MKKRRRRTSGGPRAATGRTRSSEPSAAGATGWPDEAENGELPLGPAQGGPSDRRAEVSRSESCEGPRRAAIPERADSPDASREVLRQVGREVLSSALDPEAWAQALSECRGTHDDALALYARIRAERLGRHYLQQRERVQELESRRRVCFRDFQSVEMTAPPRTASNGRGLAGLIDAIFWHVLAMVGLAGSLLAARILWPAQLANVADGTIVALIVAMQLIPIAAWWAGSGRRGLVSYPGVAQLTACVALFGSVLLAVKLLGGGGNAPDGLMQPVSPWQDGFAAVAPPQIETQPADPLLARTSRDRSE